MSDLIKKINEIEEHFTNISEEEFEINLEKAGFKTIKSASESDMELVEVK